MSIGDYGIPTWKPSDTICVGFDDKTAENRTQERIAALIRELREVANRYDFDLHYWGTEQTVKRMFRK